MEILLTVFFGIVGFWTVFSFFQIINLKGDVNNMKIRIKMLEKGTTLKQAIIDGDPEIREELDKIKN